MLAEHPDVAEAAVFARPHPLWGEAITAWVVAQPGAELTQASLRAHCLERLAGFKVPKTFELVDALPRTESGKVRARGPALAATPLRHGVSRTRNVWRLKCACAAKRRAARPTGSWPTAGRGSPRARLR